MSISKVLLFVVAILFGIFMFVYGEYDDSPGGQLLGLILVIFGIGALIMGRRKNSNKV